MSDNNANPDDKAFQERRDAARVAVNAIDAEERGDAPERESFFNAVYERAGGDPAFVPWADLKPKAQLVQWLEANPGKVDAGFPSGLARENANAGQGKRAIDIACGLGDNAEALAAAGYATTAFDLARDAVEWAKKRFPDTTVDYRVANLLEPPREWRRGFDLVHECYTLQSVTPQMLDDMVPAVADLVAPGGTLLVYTRIRPDGTDHEGPPWPLMVSDAMRFADLGLELVEKTEFENRRPDRTIPHWFCEWRRPT